MKNRILFVHIPKTAGTSFRKEAERHFGVNTIYDYGKEQVETHSFIRKLIYEEEDYYLLRKWMDGRKSLFLSGHFPVSKYFPLFETLNVVTFVRNPIAQVVSHFNHHKRYYGYEKDLRDFVNEERFQNLQSRMLKHKPLELYGLIGITERYRESIELFNHYFGLSFNEKRLNVNELKSVEPETLDEEILRLIRKKNQEDIECYKRCCELFDNHYETYRRGGDYIYIHLQHIERNRIRGCAYGRNDRMVKVYIGEKNYQHHFVKANEQRGMFSVHNMPRYGYIGFTIDLEVNHDKNRKPGLKGVFV